MNKRILKNTSNMFKDILIPLDKRKQVDDEDMYVYFQRYIGFDNINFYKYELSSIIGNIKEKSIPYLAFQGNIAITYSIEMTEKITALFQSGNNLSIEDAIELLFNKGIFNINDAKIIDALKVIANIYITTEQSVNESMFISFIVKMTLWINSYLKSEHLLNREYNSKAIYYGSIKKHEVYFLTLLSHVGFDVIYINPLTDEDYMRFDKENKFSTKTEGHLKDEIKNFEIIKTEVEPSKVIDIRHTLVINNEGFRTQLASSEDVFKDIFIPLRERHGFKEGHAPVIPIYFYRYMGIGGDGDIAKDEYYNKIYKIDRKLNIFGSGYIKFDNIIPMPNNEELTKITEKLQSGINTSDIKNIEALTNRIINLNVLPRTMDNILNSAIVNSFKRVVNLYIENESNINISRLENFILKMLSWADKYFHMLFKCKNNDLPKIMFYGNIKSHEVYFLIFASSIGCDVLYINADSTKDEVFKQIDKKSNYSALTENKWSELPDHFPISERIIRKETVAFNAEREVQKIIYTDDVSIGLFKPWQFENYEVAPISLKTTYDELKILWKEEAKIRPGFKIENGKVYIPNLFAKVNGVSAIINDYWADFKELTNSQNTRVINQVPFSKIPYTRQELYSCAFLLDKEGLVNKEKLVNSNQYKFKHLRPSLQNLILDKINELMHSNIFNITLDEKFRLKILMTILNLDEETLKLIEKFDYPCIIPKVVIYNNTINMFSDEDLITIAFVNIIGVDIVIFTPDNYRTIEAGIRETFFDIHQLPKVEFDLKIPEKLEAIHRNSKSFMSKIFGL